MRPASQDQPRSVSREIDDVTLARAIRGERPALHQLVQHHQSLVWSYLWRMLRPRADEAVVQDLFQETFLGVHRALPRFSPTGPARLSTWILAIATRVALNHLRQQRRDQPADADNRGRRSRATGARGWREWNGRRWRRRWRGPWRR